MDIKKYPGSLHSHTDFSNFRLRDAITTVKTLIDKAIELGHGGIAITEHDTISSAIRIEKYYKEIKKKHPDFKVLRGNEIYLTRNGLNASNYDREVDRYYHFVLIAKNAKGHQQIRELSTRAWSHAYTYRGMMRVPTYYQDLWDIVEKEPGNLIATTACLGGLVGTQLMKYEKTKDPDLLERIKKWIIQINELFGQGNFFLELQPSANKEQISVNQKLVELGKELNIPTLINLDAHYLTAEDRPIHKAFLTAQNGDRETDEFYMTTYMMDTDEILDFMKTHIDEADIYKAFENGWKVLDVCEDYELMKPLNIPYLPLKPIEPNPLLVEEWSRRIPLLKPMSVSQYDSDRHLVGEIIHRIKDNNEFHNQETYDEIDKNLDSIIKTSEASKASWSAYLLNMKDYIDIAWEKGGTIVGPGRGSGVGFIQLYILGITQVNPLKETTKTYHWRFINPERVSPLDIDIDIEGSKRQSVYRALQETYGEQRVSKVLTLRTEKSRSAILTAARGLGIDIETAQHIASLVSSERGLVRTLSQTYYGDEELGIKPNREFVQEMEKHPDLWKVAKYIEGLISGVGSHAGGIIFTNEPFYNSTALMKTANGDVVTQFDLHEAEDVGLIKIDLLSVEALDRIHTALDLLVQHGYVEPEESLKETYEKILGIYNIERDDPKMWEMVWNHEVQSLFQMEQQSGIQGIGLTKPKSVDELAVLNSVIRLMATERGAEQPLNKFARFKNNPHLWEQEMSDYGLTEDEKNLLRPILETSFGICESQEKFMSLVQLPAAGGHSLLWADRLRKAVGKKDPVEYDKLTVEFFEVAEKKNLSMPFCRYIWNVLVATSRGYGFNASHTLAYSLIGLQEMNLAYRFPRIFWDTACLIVDSGGGEEGDVWSEDEDEEETVYTSGPEVFDTEEEDDDDDEEAPVAKKAKAKPRSIDFGKIATAIGKIQSFGIKVLPPDINLSSYTFTPNVKNNTIHYGLSGIAQVGEDLVQSIMANRPYTSFEDFVGRVKQTKPQTIKLIKAGAFDEFGDRESIMSDYLKSIADTKKVINLRNMRLVLEKNLLPETLELEVKIFNFNKYLKGFKSGNYYLMNEISLGFFEKNFDYNLLVPADEDEEALLKIPASAWDKIYRKRMDPIRNYLKANQSEVLSRINDDALEVVRKKYASGNVRTWEMDSISFYSDKHELDGVNLAPYGVEDFFQMSETPEVEAIIHIKGKPIKLYHITRIAGSVLDRNKQKGIVTLLTTTGVVQVRIFGALFAHYDKQISEIVPESGRKRIVERSVFSRGNKIIVSGIRQGDMFIAKKYARTPFSLIEKITDIGEDGSLTLVRRNREGE